jgi:hypothetical protein
MQINIGTISINTVLNPALVKGSTTVDWTQVEIGNIFVCQNSSHVITSVNAGDQEITISPAWAQGNVTGVTYAILRDFTLNHHLPLLNPGDLEGAAIFSRAMQLLDALVGQAESTTNEVLISGSATDIDTTTPFIVGNLVAFKATGWFLCRTDDATKQLPIGIVTWVATDGLSFKIKTEGRITGILGISLTAGSKYYIRATPTAGGGQLVNITDVTGSAGSVLVPVLIADGANSGYLLNLSSAQSAVFTAIANGLVPAPTVATGTKFLRDDATWQSLGISAGSISAEHLQNTLATINWTNFSTGTAGLSILKHIIDLQTRLLALEGGNSVTPANTPTDVKVAYTRQLFTYLSNPSGTWQITVPNNVTYLIITLISAGQPVRWYSTETDKSELEDLDGLSVSPTFVRFKLSVAAGNVINGTLGSYGNPTTNTEVYNGAVSPVNLKAYVNEFLTPFVSLHGSITQFQSGRFSIEKIGRLLYPASTVVVDSGAFVKTSRRISNTVSGFVTVYAPKGIALVEYGNGANVGLVG